MADTLETLDLTNPPRAISISQQWLSRLRCLGPLTAFKKLKSLTVFESAIYIPGDGETAPYVAELLESLEHLHVQWTSISDGYLYEFRRDVMAQKMRCPLLRDLNVYEGEFGDEMKLTWPVKRNIRDGP